MVHNNGVNIMNDELPKAARHMVLEDIHFSRHDDPKVRQAKECVG